MKLLKTLASSLFSETPAARRGAGDARAYAVGDVHGRLDLLERLIETIAGDARGRPPKKTYIVFLGDLIDRGPESRGVIERLLSAPLVGMAPVFLMGNHEEVLLRILEGERGILWNWLKFGGAECIESYGVDAAALSHMREDEALRAVRLAIPQEHRKFLADCADTFSFGDYLFVHAGIRPGVPLEAQRRQDLRWIREPFLTDESDLGRIVVHGHTIVDSIRESGSRIGIDTGAYRSGILTALGVEGDQRWYLSTAG